MDPQTLSVVVGGSVVGQVELVEKDEEIAVLAVGLDDLRHVDVLRALLDCRAIAAGAASITLDVSDEPGAPGAAATLAAAGFETASVRLRLDLGAGPPARPDRDPVLRLAPMGPEAYAAFVEALGDDDVLDLLGDGPQSAGQHLFTAWVADVVVGHLWIATASSEAFVHHVEVVEEQRRRGHGTALVRAAADWAREQGAHHLGAEVPGHLGAARALYAAQGYAVTGTTYRRLVGP